MSKGKKNIIVLLVTVVLVAGLAGVYIWQNNRQLEAEASVTPSPTPDTSALLLIDREVDDVENVVFKTSKGSLTLAAVRNGENADGTVDHWILADDPDIAIDQTTAGDMVRGMYYLSMVEKLMDRVDNPADFGISPDEATAVATYSDGSTATLHIGKMTPAKDRYYMMLEGDPALYLAYSYYGSRYFNEAGALIDRTLATIESDSMEYILIQERGKEPIEFGFFGTDEEKAAMYEEYGMIYVTMLQPYPGRELYYSNFENAVLTEFKDMTLGDFVALRPDDLSVYGLDDPSLTLWMRSKDAEIHLQFGNQTEDGKIYCKFYDKPSVFLTDYNYIKSLYNINVFAFIERFIALVNIDECDEIDIVSADGRNYTMILNHEILPPEGEQTEGDNIVNPVINGQLVQDLAFRTYYQRLIGLSYDVQLDETFEPTEEPAFTVTYNMIDKEPIVVRFYAYDTNFYAVKRDDNPIQFVANRQSTEMMFQSILDLLAGMLNR